MSCFCIKRMKLNIVSLNQMYTILFYLVFIYHTDFVKISYLEVFWCKEFIIQDLISLETSSYTWNNEKFEKYY